MSLCAQCSQLAAWLLSNEFESAVFRYKRDIESDSHGGTARFSRIFPCQKFEDKHTSESAFNQGCPLCGLILHTPSTNLEGNIFVRLCPLGRQISVWTSGIGWHNTLEWQGRSFEIYSADYKQSLWCVRDHLGSHPLSDNTISIVGTWLLDCLQTHQECSTHNQSGYRPTRLIDVGLVNGADEPRLVDLDEESQLISPGRDRSWLDNLKYATLSHCWGKSPHLTTTSNTLEARKESIPMQTLNKTLADAVLVTRRLRLQYVWIDSLCIIQDSPVDWNRESAKMCHVYNNAVVNIAAISAEDADDGFLHNRHVPVFLSRTSIADRWGSMDEHGLWLRPSTAREWRYEGSSLYRRAWCFQESILSPRILRFGLQEVSFQCRRHALSEKMPELTEAVDAQIAGFTLMIHDVPNMIQNPNFAYNMWRGIFERYSTKELTYEEDRLPALSGLASRFANLFNDHYLAGLWKCDLPLALCWQSMSRHAGSIVGPYAIPSWSWVPYFQVTYGRNLDEVTWEALAQQSEVDVVSDTYGRVCGGSLLIQGRVLDVTVEARQQSPWCKIWAASHLGNRPVTEHFKLDDGASANESADHICLLLGYRLSSTDESLWHAVVMVLEWIDDYGAFKRVGLIMDHLDIDESATPKAIWEAAETDWVTIR